jgi:hypothetical protein
MWRSGSLRACTTHLACLKHRVSGERISRFICAPAGVRPTVIADAKPV